jgi:uncharacterized protein (DUF2141 family)
LAASILLPAAAPPASGTLELQVLKLRNARGLVRVCVTALPSAFPDCRQDPAAYRLSIAAGKADIIRLDAIRPGIYAVALLHDENGNGQLDTFAAIPKEGYGFSRDAPIRFGPPRFEQAQISVASGDNRQSIRMRYLL